MKSILLAGLVLVALVQPASAQEPVSAAGGDTTDDDDDWDLIRDPSRDLTAAAAIFENGVAIAARCMEGGFDVIMTGLPPADGQTRLLQVGIDDEPLHDESWMVTVEPTVAISDFPTPFARRLRQGGNLNVVVAGTGDAPNRRYILNLPASPSAIETVLTECGKPLVDPRADRPVWVSPDGSLIGLRWERRPAPTYPSEARNRNVAAGRVVLTCVVQAEGRVGDCEVESEQPRGYGFGEATLDGVRRARVATDMPDQPEAGLGRMISFRVNYLLR